MAELTPHREPLLDPEEESERADRALAHARDVFIVSTPRSVTAGSLSSFRDYVREQLINKPVGIVVDCARLEYIDSSGLALLFSLAKDSKRRGIQYRVARLDENLRYLLSITCIDRVINVSTTLRGAILEASDGEEVACSGSKYVDEIQRPDAGQENR